jgi:hypothetical protein
LLACLSAAAAADSALQLKRGQRWNDRTAREGTNPLPRQVSSLPGISNQKGGQRQSPSQSQYQSQSQSQQQVQMHMQMQKAQTPTQFKKGGVASPVPPHHDHDDAKSGVSEV